MKRNRWTPWLAVATAVLYQVLVWFVWYRLAGYDEVTLLVAQLGFALLAVGLLVVFRFDAKRAGLGAGHLVHAVLGIAAGYGFLLAALLVVNLLGGEYRVFRETYYPMAFVDNWLLTGLGEELFFAGVLFTLVRRQASGHRGWLAVLLTAASFAVWHLPGYVAVALSLGQGLGSIVSGIMLNLLSWAFFGTIYLYSGNLWLVAFTHASTDYGLLPAITDSPVLGLLFMLSVVAIAWWLGRARGRRLADTAPATMRAGLQDSEQSAFRLG